MRHAAITERGRGWLVVAAAFIGGFVVFGVMYSFGTFFTAMVHAFDASRTEASGFFAATGCAFYILGAAAGHLADRVGPRIVVAAGAIVMSSSLVLTAFIEHLWVGYLTYGIGMGLGAACAYVPTPSAVGGWSPGAAPWRWASRRVAPVAACWWYRRSVPP